MSYEKKTVTTADGPMIVHVTSPGKGAEGKFPALIVLQEAFGVNAHIRHVCQRFADNGYIAIAPELFHRAGPGIEVDYTDFAKSRPLMGPLTNERLLDDVGAALKLAKDLPQVDSKKIGAIGYCMGGFVAVLGACHLPLQAAISFYGGGMTKERPGIGFTPILEDFANLKCPVYLGWGALDHGISPEDVATVSRKLASLHKDATSKVYPESNHGFMCDDRSAYNPKMSQLAWDDTFNWLKMHLS